MIVVRGSHAIRQLLSHNPELIMGQLPNIEWIQSSAVITRSNKHHIVFNIAATELELD